jgi:phospholipid transport system transporter-binding protein
MQKARMSNATLTTGKDGNWLIHGELVFATVPGLLVQAARLFDGQKKLVIDLGGVTHSDSAGLALVLEWLDECRRAGRALQVQRPPQSMLDIARVSNVSDLLPLLSD